MAATPSPASVALVSAARTRIREIPAADLPARGR